jgi:hypothetical protein
MTAARAGPEGAPTTQALNQFGVDLDRNMSRDLALLGLLNGRHQSLAAGRQDVILIQPRFNLTIEPVAESGDHWSCARPVDTCPEQDFSWNPLVELSQAGKGTQR